MGCYHLSRNRSNKDVYYSRCLAQVLRHLIVSSSIASSLYTGPHTSLRLMMPGFDRMRTSSCLNYYPLDIISLFHFSCGKRKTHWRSFPEPRSTEHSSDHMIFSQSLYLQCLLSNHQASRLAATSGESKGRFFASQLVRPYSLRTR